jgi:hypothetical protein
MKRCLLMGLLMLVALCLNAQIYKWTDSQGNVHFSDTPKAGAKILNMPEDQTYSPPSAPINIEPQVEEKQKNNSDHQYTKVVIIQPENEGTVRNNQGYVAIAVQIEPTLVPGDKLQLIFDGAPMGDPQTSPLFQINGVYRGSHSIAVEVLDKDSNVLNTSESITIHMQRARINQAR